MPYPLNLDPHHPFNVLLLHGDGADNGAVITDSALGAAVTRVGAPVTKTGTKKFGTASIYFEGVSSYLTVPDSDNWNFAGGDFTIDCWINLTSVTAYQTIACQYTTATTNNAWALRYYNISGLVLTYTTTGNSADAKTAASGPLNLQPNTWYFVSIARKGTSLRFFVDGVQVGATYNMGADVIYNASTSALNVGSLGGTMFLNGYLDDLRITKGLCRYEANHGVPIYAAPDGGTVLLMNMNGANDSFAFTDAQGLYAITRTGTPVMKTAVKAFGQSSALFNGTTDRLNIPATPNFNLAGADFTIEAHVQFTTVPTTGYADLIRSSGGSFSVCYYGVSGKWFFGYNVSSTEGRAASFEGTTVFTAGVMYHLAFVREGQYIRMFVDGVQEGAAVYMGVDVVYWGAAYTYGIGGSPANSNWLAAYVDALRITRGVARYLV